MGSMTTREWILKCLLEAPLALSHLSPLPLTTTISQTCDCRGPGASRLPWRVVLSVMCTRLVLQPVLLTGGVVAALQLGLYRPPDAMFLLTLLLANATPTAINLQTMTVLYDHGAEEMSQLLFWQYLASLLTLPAFMWLFLHIIDAFMVV